MAEMTSGQVKVLFNSTSLPADLGGHLKQVLQLSAGAWSPASMRTRLPPLHFLVVQGSVEQVRLLLAHEVDVDCQTACGWLHTTPHCRPGPAA